MLLKIKAANHAEKFVSAQKDYKTTNTVVISPDDGGVLFSDARESVPWLFYRPEQEPKLGPKSGSLLGYHGVCSGVIGISIRNDVPDSWTSTSPRTRVSKLKLPPWPSTTSLAITKPKPVSESVPKFTKGTKICDRVLRGIPGPVAATDNCQRPSA